MASAGINPSGKDYEYNVTATNKSYCLEETIGGQVMSMTSTDQTLKSGECIYNGFIAWWPLNGNIGDQSGNNMTGTLYGTTVANGQNGQAGGALYFNGTATDYSSFSFNKNVMKASALRSNWTISIWSKWGGAYTEEAILMGRQGCNGGIYLYTSRYAFAIKGAGCWDGAQTILNSTLDSNWHLLTGTYEAGVMSFYDNGVLQGTATLLNMYGYADSFGVGSGGSPSWPYNGTLDDARVYNRALSAQEVQALYNAGAQ